VPQKNYSPEAFFGRIDGSGEPQNARISADRFAAVAAAPSRCGEPRRDSRARFSIPLALVATRRASPRPAAEPRRE